MSSGCGDVLSLADLQTAKKHQIFEAEVITGKSGGVAGGEDIDYATNQVTGQTQKTLPAVLRDAGFSPVSWDFSTGGTLTVNDRDKVVYDPVSQTWYSYAGTLPVVVPAGFNPVGNADWKPQTDPNLRDDLATPGAVDVSGGNVTVEAVSPFTKDLPLNTFASKVATIDMFTGVVADGVTDTRQAVQDAIIACASAGVRLRITAGVYAFANWLGIPSNADIVFDSNAVFKLLNYTTIDTGGPSPVGFGGFVVIGYLWDTQATKVEGKNIHIEGMNLDVNGLDGENAFGGVLCTNVRVVNTRIKGTVHSNARLGGKAVQFEGGLCQDVQIDNLYIENCSIGISSQGLAGTTTNNQRCITYNDVFMKNVGVPVMSYGQAANPDTATSNEQSLIINGLVMHNCGSAQSFTGVPGAAGLFCADRGANITINNVRLFNDAAYGAIGAIFRGPMFNVNVSNAYFEAPYIVAIVDQTAVGFGAPSAAAFNSYVATRDFRVKLTNLDVVAKAPSASVGPHDLEISLDVTNATLATIFDTNIAASALLAPNAMLHLTNTVTGESTGRRSFSDIYRQGNTPALCMKVKDMSATWVPADASGASLALTINGTQKLYRHGESVTVCLNVTYPTTADTRVAAISGLGIAGLSGVNFAGIGATINAAGATAVVKGGEAFIRFLTASGGNVTNADLSGKNLAVVVRYLI